MSDTFYTKVERYGNNILWSGYDNGDRFYKKVKYQPTLYVETKTDNAEYVSLIGNKPLKPMLFNDMKSATDFIKKYQDVSNLTICGNANFPAAFTYEQYPSTVGFDPSLIHVAMFDIEVDISKKKPDMKQADSMITSIAYKSSKSDIYHAFGYKDYDPNATVLDIDPSCIRYHKFKTERELLLKFVEIWTSDYPDVVTGWNCEFFDIAYIVRRIENVLGASVAKKLSPWGIIRERTVEIYKKPQTTYVLSGISIIDYMNAFKKFGYKYGTLQSYKLDNVAVVVLGTKKVSYQEEYGTLTQLYEKNHQLYIDYNIYDTRLVEMFEETVALLQLTFTVAYKSGVNFNEAFGTVGVWDTTIFRALMQKGIVPFVKTSPMRDDESIPGGFVKDPQVGMKHWVVSFDLNSLYPHLMMQYNMSPETYVRNHKENVSQESILTGEYVNSTPYAVAANGACFRKDFKGIIPQIIESYYDERAQIKRDMLQAESKLEKASTDSERKQLKKQITQLHNSQMSIKILMNGLYGSTANEYFIYYISDMAEAITTSGQLSVKWAGQIVNQYLNSVLKTEEFDYVSYTDTDSVVRDSIIYVNGNRIAIGDYYDSIGGKFLRYDDFNRDYIKEVDNGDLSYSVSLDYQLQEKRIKYVMKHRVRKEMFEIKANGKTVVVTEDHSIIVKLKDTGEMISIKPRDLDREKHYIINIDTDSNTGEDSAKKVNEQGNF